jgi:hypothetical protein
VNEYSEADLAAHHHRNGEGAFTRDRGEIVAARPLRNTGDLVEAVKAGIPAPGGEAATPPHVPGDPHEVNHELPNSRRARRIGAPARSKAGCVLVPLARGSR